MSIIHRPERNNDSGKKKNSRKNSRRGGRSSRQKWMARVLAFALALMLVLPAAGNFANAEEMTSSAKAAGEAAREVQEKSAAAKTPDGKRETAGSSNAGETAASAENNKEEKEQNTGSDTKIQDTEEESGEQKSEDKSGTENGKSGAENEKSEMENDNPGEGNDNTGAKNDNAGAENEKAGAENDNSGEESGKSEEEKNEKADPVSKLEGNDGSLKVTVKFAEPQDFPEGTALRVEKVEADSAEYKDLYKHSLTEIYEEGKNILSGAEYFTIAVVDENGEKIIPVSAADVEVSTADTIKAEGDESAEAIAFSSDDLKDLDVSCMVKDGDEEKTYPSLHHVTGTVTGFKFAVKDWDYDTFGTFLSAKRTADNGEYVIVRQGADGNYYALASDGSAVRVDYDAEKNTAARVVTSADTGNAGADAGGTEGFAGIAGSASAENSVSTADFPGTESFVSTADSAGAESFVSTADSAGAENLGSTAGTDGIEDSNNVSDSDHLVDMTPEMAINISGTAIAVATFHASAANTGSAAAGEPAVVNAAAGNVESTSGTEAIPSIVWTKSGDTLSSDGNYLSVTDGNVISANSTDLIISPADADNRTSIYTVDVSGEKLEKKADFHALVLNGTDFSIASAETVPEKHTILAEISETLTADDENEGKDAGNNSVEDNAVENKSTESRDIEGEGTGNKTIENEGTGDKAIDSEGAEDKNVESEGTENKDIESEGSENRNTENGNIENESTEDKFVENKDSENKDTEEESEKQTDEAGTLTGETGKGKAAETGTTIETNKETEEDKEIEKDTGTKADKENGAGSGTETGSGTEAGSGTGAGEETETDKETEADKKTEADEEDREGSKGEAAPGTLEATTDNYRVFVSYDSSANIPEDAKLRVTEIAENSDEFSSAKSLVISARQNADENFNSDNMGMKALNIKIITTDENGVESEFEPESAVTVKIEATGLPEDAQDVQIHHITGTGSTNMDLAKSSLNLVKKAQAAVGSVAQTAEEVASGVSVEDGKAEAEFTVSSFSTFTITYLGSDSTTKFAVVTIHYVDRANPTEELTTPAQQDITRQYVHSFSNATYTLSDYAVSLDGYEYLGAHFGSYDGTEVGRFRFVYGTGSWGHLLGSNYLAFDDTSNNEIKSLTWEYHDDNNSQTMEKDVYLVYDRSPIADVTLHYVDGNGDPITDSAGNPVVANKEIKVGRGESYSISDYETTITGYAFSGAHLGSVSGSAVTGFSATRTGDYPDYTKTFTINNNGSEVESTVYSSETAPASNGYLIKRDVYLIYQRAKIAEVNVHYVDQNGNAISSVSLTPNPIEVYAGDAVTLADYDANKKYAKDIDGYTYRGIYLENGTDDAASAFSGTEPAVTGFTASRSGSAGAYVKTLAFSNGDTQVDSTVYNTGDEGHTDDGIIAKDVYIVYYHPYGDVTIHYVDENGDPAKGADGNAIPAKTFDGSDASSYTLSDYLNDADGNSLVDTGSYVFEAAHLENSDDGKYSGNTADPTITNFEFKTVVSGTGSEAVTKSAIAFTNGDNEDNVWTFTYEGEKLHKDVYLVYNRIYAQIKIHYADTTGKKLTDSDENTLADAADKTVNVQAGDEYIFSVYADTFDNYKYQKAHYSTYNGTEITRAEIVTSTEGETTTRSLVFYGPDDNDEEKAVQTVAISDGKLTQDVYLVYEEGESSSYIHYVDENGNRLYLKYGLKAGTYADAASSDDASYRMHLIYDVQDENGNDYDYVGTYYFRGTTSTNPTSGTQIVPTLKYFSYSTSSDYYQARSSYPSWYQTAGRDWYFRTLTGDTATGATAGSYTQWQPLYSTDNIYVVYKRRAAATQGQSAVSDPEKDRPYDMKNLTDDDLEKTSTDNGDGTRTISLSVTGREKDSESPSHANVILVVDTSNSMNRDMDGNSTSSSGESSRLTVEKQALNGTDSSDGLIHTLLSKTDDNGDPTTKIAIVSFDNRARLKTGFSDNETTLTNAVSSLATPQSYGATNWEDALKMVNEMSVGSGSGAFQDAPTYVIFVTDGDPTMRNSRGNVNEENLTSANSQIDDDSFYYSYEDSSVYYSDSFDDSRYTQYAAFGNGGYQQYDYDFALDQAKRITGSNKLFYSIGVSSDVTRLQTFTSDAGGEECYVATNQEALNSAFSQITARIVTTLGFSDVKIMDGITGMANLSGKADGTAGNFIYTMTDSNGNSLTVPDDLRTAVYDSESGSVIWQMPEDYQLKAGVKYTVSFEIWPDQTALDHVAKLKRGEESWDELSNDVKNQITRSGSNGNYTYSLKTNTSASASAADSASSGGEVTVNKNIGGSVVTNDAVTIGDEVSGIALDTGNLTVQKTFANSLDNRGSESVNLNLMRDEEKKAYATMELGGTNDSSNTEIISTGIIDRNGTILDSGHDFTVTETIDNTDNPNAYHWDLDAPTYRPMLINGAVTMLQKTDSKPASGTKYEIPADSGNWYVPASSNTTLTATNYRRSNLNLTKAVTGDRASTDTWFTFDITVNVPDDAADDDKTLWFSLRDGDDQIVTTTQYSNFSISGATSQDDGYYTVASKSTVSIKVKPGWNLRFINLPKGTTYTVKESSINSGYGFKEAAVTASGQTTKVSDSAFSYSGTTAAGSIEQYNTMYAVTVTNQNPAPGTTSVTVKKVAENGSTALSGTEFTLTGADGTAAAVSGVENGKATTGAEGTISFSLPNGTYTLTETGAPDGYKKLENPAVITVSGNGSSANQGTVTVRYGSTDVTSASTGTVMYNSNTGTITVKDEKKDSVSVNDAVTLHKTVAPTSTENRFTVTLSVDLKAALENYFRQTGIYGAAHQGNYKDTDVGTIQTSMNSSELKIGPDATYGSNYVTMTITSHSDIKLIDGIRLYWSSGSNNTFYINLGKDGSGNDQYLIIGAKVNSGNTLNFKLSEDAEEALAYSVLKTAKLTSITDQMGAYVNYVDGSLKANGSVVSGSDPSYDSSTQTITWSNPVLKNVTPTLSTETVHGEQAAVYTYKGAVELSYDVTLNRSKDGYVGSDTSLNNSTDGAGGTYLNGATATDGGNATKGGTSVDGHWYNTNTAAKLTYTDVNSTSHTIDFPTPLVQGTRADVPLTGMIYNHSFRIILLAAALAAAAFIGFVFRRRRKV